MKHQIIVGLLQRLSLFGMLIVQSSVLHVIAMGETPPNSEITLALNKNADVLAFPGAEGFGRNAKGGRGGRVIPRI